MIVYNSNRDREKKLFQGGKESEEKIFLKKKNIILFHLIESTQLGSGRDIQKCN